MSTFAWRRMVWISILAAISSSLYAVDGVILIDQKIARTGNLSPGDTPGFPVTISQTGSYRLAENLIVPDAVTTAIHITADHVTLDLNGFSIIGPTICTGNPTTCNTSGGGVGIHAGDFQAGTIPARGVNVRNGTVRGIGFHGVRLMGDGAVVERVRTIGNGGPGIVVGNGAVIDSMAFNNGGVGIIALTARGNVADGNGSVGIFMRDGGVAAGNSSNSNNGDGISATKATVTGNTVIDNKGYGILANCPSSIVGNTVVGNLRGGIQPAGAGVCTLANNAQ